MYEADLYLASKSPRRADLLKNLCIQFNCLDFEIDETVAIGEKPQDYVLRLAQDKATFAWQLPQRRLQIPVLAADTTVICDNKILGKPQNKRQAHSWLRELSGKSHFVLTAIAITNGERLQSQLVSTEVRFVQLSNKAIAKYLQHDEWKDKAGGYAIQGLACQFVQHIIGSYSAVVGLPLYETAQLCHQFQIETL